MVRKPTKSAVPGILVLLVRHHSEHNGIKTRCTMSSVAMRAQFQSILGIVFAVIEKYLCSVALASSRIQLLAQSLSDNVLWKSER